jgi:2-polyprenyl-3-methyl-5-hydroxy-6-metoxy-1,4-benzoquinol methylase
MKRETQTTDQFYGNASSDQAKQTYRTIEIDTPSDGFQLGPYNTYGLLSDPKRTGFLFARHKFVAKMLEGYNRVLEIGCQEGLGSMIVAQAAGHLVATDFYKPHIESCLNRLTGLVANIEFRGHDMIDAPIKEDFDGAFSMDVIEHIDPDQEDLFMTHVCASLCANGVFVVGTPSLESQKYASPASKAGHINCKSGEELRALCKRFFHSVFMFGMNDEVLHTGFLPMAHYLIALCVHPKSVAT